MAIWRCVQILKAEKLRHQYGRQVVIDGFSYEFSSPAIYGLMGPNGAGKSTLLRLLAGVERPTAGMVYFKGRPIRRPERAITCAWQNPFLFTGTVEENVAYGLRIRGYEATDCRRRVEKLLSLFDLLKLRRYKIDKLSPGLAARVALARAVAPYPEVLLLDEVMAAMDPVSMAHAEEALLRLKEEEGMLVIMVTHDPAQARRLCKELLVIEEGQLCAAGPPEVIAKAKVFLSPTAISGGKER